MKKPCNTQAAAGLAQEVSAMHGPATHDPAGFTLLSQRLLATCFDVSTSMAVCLAILLVARRLHGQLTQPLTFGGYLTFAAALVCLTSGWRAVASSLPRKRVWNPALSAWLLLLPHLLSLVVLASVSLPGTPFVAVGLGWLAVLGQPFWPVCLRTIWGTLFPRAASDRETAPDRPALRLHRPMTAWFVFPVSSVLATRQDGMHQNGSLPHRAVVKRYYAQQQQVGHSRSRRHAAPARQSGLRPASGQKKPSRRPATATWQDEVTAAPIGLQPLSLSVLASPPAAKNLPPLWDAKCQLDQGPLPHHEPRHKLDALAAELEAEPYPAHHLQEMIRSRMTPDTECIQGWTRGYFAAGERSINLHLAFCPPLVSLPEVECNQAVGPPATIKVAQAEPFGLRLEVRLDQLPNEPTEVVIEFQAIADMLPLDSSPAGG